MKLTELETGTKLQLEVMDDGGKDVKNVFASEFEWAEDDKNLYIAAPIYEGDIYPLPVGSIINVYIFYRQRNLGMSDIYMCKASVIERINNQRIAMLKIKILGNTVKIQRRQFFRFEFTLPVKYREVELSGTKPGTLEKKSEEASLKNAVTRDISGGGICIAAEEKLEKGKILEFHIALGGSKSICFLGKIVRIGRRLDSKKYKYEAGIAFEAIDEKDRDEIIRFIFFEQRKLRKKGLI